MFTVIKVHFRNYYMSKSRYSLIKPADKFIVE